MMNMKKTLALLLAAVMVLGMFPFGAMAEETVTCTCTPAEDGTHAETCALYEKPQEPKPEEPKQEQPTCTCTPAEDGTHAETCVLYVKPVIPAAEEPKQETPVCTCTPAEDGTHAETCARYEKPVTPAAEEPKQEQPTCTCTPAEDGTHAETCALYEKPQEPKPEEPKQEQPTCTCTPAEDGTHAETCALYEKPQEPKPEEPKQEQPTCTCTPTEDGIHAETCALNEKPQEPVEEVPPVDYAALYESIMNCEDLFAADALVDALTQQQLAAFEASLTEEQSSALDAHYAALIAAYEAEVPTEPVPEEEAAEEDTREIVYITKDMTKAAPFGAPVEGPAKRMLMRSFRATPAAQDENGLILDKSVSGPNTNGEYTITLEAYATGEKTTIKQELNVPTDIVLVLDQSGSMDESFASTAYRETSGNPGELYSKRNNLYVKLSDNSYSPVTVKWDYVGTAAEYSSYSNEKNRTYYSNRNNLYHKCSDNSYGKITVYRTGYSGNRNYTYTCVNCGSLGNTSYGADTRPNYSASFYLAETQYVYQYTFSYKKEDGTTETQVVLATDNAPNWSFYESYASGQSTTKLAALKNAVSTFANEVATKAKGVDGVLGNDDDVHHTISVVGFASGYSYTHGSGWDQETDYYYYGNTELFVGNTAYTYNAGQQNNASNVNAAQQHYDNAPQDMATEEGVANVTASINALDGNGGTIIDLGMEMANGILAANPVPAGQKRNRVVIVFTDGIPGWSGYDSTVANNALARANTTKDTHKATVYTVGIFEGAQASSAGNSSGSETEKANWFMQNLSSNGGTVQDPSYYLSASDSAALNTIFKTISENIENGGSSIELDGDTVVKDIIADSFKLPDNANTGAIKVYTDDVDSTTGEFNDNPQQFNASVTIDGKDISVSNFDFSENWVGSETDASGNVTYRGQKLIIEIPIVPNPDFLGGNNVPTNGEASGVYSGGELVEAFKAQKTDVSIKVLDIGVVTTDQNIYLTNDADLAKLVTGLDKRINGANNAYVDITYQIKDGDTVVGTVSIPVGDTVPTSITWTEAENQDMTPGLEADKTYTIVATAEPVTTGTATETTNKKTANVNVFKPTVTWKDTEVSYNQKPVYETQNLDSIDWMHGETLDTEVNMLNGATAPELTYTYDPEATELKAESHVKITKVEIGEKDVTQYVTHKHKNCTITGCKWDAEDHTDDCNFIVHLATFDLTITKAGVRPEDNNAAFIFNVSGNGVNMNVVIYGGNSVTIKNLPAGDYTVKETSGYWRYTLDTTEQKASAANASITFTNNFKTNQWLDDIASVTNKFTGDKSNSITR